jgi:archaemetzincin
MKKSLIHLNYLKLVNIMLLSIILLLLGYNNEVSVKHVKHEIEAFYNIKVIVQRADMPNIAYYKPRHRYRANILLHWLSKTYPGDRVIAITSHDISTTSGDIYDWGIFGLGSLHNNVSVTSVYRLKGNNIQDRLDKIVLHEIGHSYGLPHCTSSQQCFMKAGDHTLRAVDKEMKILCSICKQLLINQLTHYTYEKI